MVSVWLTYSWEDNRESDVDFVAQQLLESGVEVKLDRWTIGAGKRLWEQIETFINEENCKAWLMYATPSSLGSEPCKEEYAYALERALSKRGENFPILAIFPGSVDKELIPAGIRTRLYVSLTDSDWLERVKAAAEGRVPKIATQELAPYSLQIHNVQTNGENTRPFVIEVRPRAGIWSPFIAAIPLKEKESVDLEFVPGPKGSFPLNALYVGKASKASSDNMWWMFGANNEASPTQSYFIYCRKLPSKLLFGKSGGVQYTVNL